MNTVLAPLFGKCLTKCSVSLQEIATRATEINSTVQQTICYKPFNEFPQNE